MQVGDLVRVKWTNPTVKNPDMGIVTKIVQYDGVPSKFINVTLTNGYFATYRIETLEVICK